MRVAIPHDLPRETVRERMRRRSHEIAGHIPGGMAEVTTDWPSENRMTMRISAMGQNLDGRVDIEESELVFEIDLPPALGFLEPMIAGAVRQQGQKLIGKG
ncbi:polyhydroxyalkanoic acid system family protein [Pelagerythrobacter marensis]|uniref:Polyhydroxyalkanoic acid system family protein n=1 Tax=Pelagerythrobacter marensis TaxID=543877 RepID=A0ABZ2D5X3_9SPHN